MPTYDEVFKPKAKPIPYQREIIVRITDTQTKRIMEFSEAAPLEDAPALAGAAKALHEKLDLALGKMGVASGRNA